MGADLTLAREKAWATRRLKYGPSGHGRAYGGRPNRARNNDGALQLVIELMNEGLLSEGQVCQATGLDRIHIRTLADEAAQPTTPTPGYFPQENETNSDPNPNGERTG